MSDSERNAEVTTLTALIDSGYSKYFAIPLTGYKFGEDDFFEFDAEDRDCWGETIMVADAEILAANDRRIEGYRSGVIDELFRVVCVASSDEFSPKDKASKISTEVPGAHF